MSEKTIIKRCSPTLAGLKTGNLFSCDYTDEVEVVEYVRMLNKRLVPKGLRVIPIYTSNCRVLIYVYRPEKLKYDFKDKLASNILYNHGYPIENPDRCVTELCNRLVSSSEFPHEIGLFLGYPPEDVAGFIDNKATSEKCTGCWKVYGDEEKAKELFAKYKKCSQIYYLKWKEGRSIERLTVQNSKLRQNRI